MHRQAADRTLRRLSLATIDQAWITETEVARCCSMTADPFAALEARGKADDQLAQGSTPARSDRWPD